MSSAWRTLAAACVAWGLACVAPGASPPQRIASLNLTADEILAEIVPPERLVAVTRASDDPSSSNLREPFPARIPRFFRADMERLVALRPDLVIISEYTDADFVRLLESSGLRYHRMQGLTSMAGCRQALLDLGEAVGEVAAARRLAERFDARLARVRSRLEGVARPRVLYWSAPYTAGAGTAIGALIECAGGRNVGAELGLTGLAPLGAERAFVADPDVLLVGRFEEGEGPLPRDPLLARVRAVREGHVVVLPTRLLVTLSQHAATACEVLASKLHPDRMGPSS